MKFSHFLTLVFFAASLIVGVVYLTVDDRLTSVGMTSDDTHPPDYYFLAADQTTDSRIDCPLAVDSKHPDIWAHEIAPCWPAEGWTPPSDWGSWAMGPVSRIEVDLKTTSARSLVIRARANRNLPENQEQGVTVSVNGTEIGSRRVQKEWSDLRLHVPADVLRVGRNSISMKFDFRISERDAKTGKGYLALAAGIHSMTLMAPTIPSNHKGKTAPSVDVWNEERQGFFIGEPGTLVQPCFIPTGTTRIEFTVRTSLGVDSSDIQITLGAEDLNGGSGQRSKITFPAGRSLSTARLQVGDLAGHWTIVTIGIEIETGNLEISRVRFISDEPTSKRAAADAPPEANRSQPDIVLITLDAARADRFSYAGHDRPTTPVVDELATESLVFPSAYALAPYTLCSVPTMITGLSFLDHQVTRHEHVLSPDAVTIAEYLQAAGYHTAAFSATPNNSKAKGFDQGYDVFRETWTLNAEKREARRAQFIAQQVVEWLGSLGDDPRPIHVQVHMVPPHAPYDPPAPFDLFTDPAYNEPCTGYDRTLSALDGGSTKATPECLAHLFNLYDGNLRAADDAVGTILEALRSRPRWRNTVVLVTSDHGEAFLEHGRMTHNSTLYSEMLHVPFVLRMPPGFDISKIDTQRLVTLADIAPTLLSAAGLNLPHSADSANLLAPNQFNGDRFMVARTTTSRPLLGLRTLKWSLMLNGTGAGALYDLSTDPEELDNLSARQPARYIGLGRVLTHRIGMPPRIVISTESAPITDDERSLLETLGYVRD